MSMDLELIGNIEGDMGDVGDMGAPWRPRYAPQPQYAPQRYYGGGGGYGYGYPHHHRHHHHHRPPMPFYPYGPQIMGFNPQYAAMMGAPPTWFNFLVGDDPAAAAPPPVAMQPHPHHHHDPYGFGAAHIPLGYIQPPIPGVSNRGGRQQPLGFTPGTFDSTSGTTLSVTATPQRPVRGGRVFGSYARIGTTANGLLTLATLFVGTDGQLLSSDPIGFDFLAPNSFGAGVNLTPAAVGNQIVGQVTVSNAVTGAEDSIPFSMAIFGLTVG